MITIENYFQKILSPPEKIQSPLKNQKVQVSLLFTKIEKFFRPPPTEMGMEGGRAGHCGNANSGWSLLKNLILFLFYVDNLKTLELKYGQYYLNMPIKFNEI